MPAPVLHVPPSPIPVERSSPPRAVDVGLGETGRVSGSPRAVRPRVARRHLLRKAIGALTLAFTDLAFSYLATLSMRVFDFAGLPGAESLARIASFVRGGTGTLPLYFAATLLFGLLVTGSYRVRRGPHAALDVLTGCVFAVALVYWAPMRALGLAATVLPFTITLVVLWAWVAVGRRLHERFVSRFWPSLRGEARALFVGSELAYRAALGDDDDRSLPRLVGFVSLESVAEPGALGTVRSLPSIAVAHQAEAVVVGEPLEEEDLLEVLDLALAGGCSLLYPARSPGIAGVRRNLVWRGDEPFFELGTPALRGQELFLKRLVDVVGALIGLALMAPVFAVIAVLIKLDSPGPIFFSQNRAGMFGRRFRMKKFRTMRHGSDAEKDEIAHLNRSGDPRLFKIPDDPRATRLGRWLRHWSIDELPQLWNVLTGDMSLCGPRPFFESDLADYEAHHFRRLDVKPGITGLWQVSGRSMVLDFDEVVRLDREYIERWSLWLDLSILLRTLPAVLRRYGAY